MRMGPTQYFVDYLQEYEFKISQCGRTGWTDEYKIKYLEIAINAPLRQLLMNKNLPEDDYAKWVSKVKRISGRLENSPSYRPRGSSGSKTWYVAHNGSNTKVASPTPISNQQPNLDADGDTRMSGVNALQVLQTAIMALNAGPRCNEPADTKDGKNFWDTYRNTIESSDLKSFEIGCKSLEAMSEEGWKYLWTTWFRDFTDKFAKFEMDKILHFGVVSTSRVEGNHSKLKKWLQNFRSDLYGFVEKLIPWWEDLHASIMQHLEEERRRILYSHQTPFFSQVNLRIHRYALGLLEEAMKRAREEVKNINDCRGRGKEVTIHPCRDTDRTTLGLPCLHELRDLLLRGDVLTVNHFHRHWHIPDETVETQNRPESILEPLTTPARRKNVSKKKGTGKLGNRRETLHAERVCKKSHSRKPLRTVIQQEADIRSRQLYHEIASSSRISTDDCQPCERFIYDLSEADNNAPGCSSRPLH
ncbi:hypothetical protein K3495_g65 [Podosphaera aphanis]|nr:hypothetical protein K3495_g65 [Podosphaera aphanis]